MNRREFAQRIGATALLTAAAEAHAQEKAQAMNHPMPAKPEEIAMLIYPGMTALDLIGPQQVFGYVMGCKVHMVAKTSEFVTSDSGVSIRPTKTFADCPDPIDILFVPGGGTGTISLMRDKETLAFLTSRAKNAKYVTSVCSGSLVLAAAGLLRGYKATSHWAVRDVLADFGAEVVAKRVVEDRTRITAAASLRASISDCTWRSGCGGTNMRKRSNSRSNTTRSRRFTRVLRKRLRPPSLSR